MPGETASAGASSSGERGNVDGGSGVGAKVEAAAAGHAPASRRVDVNTLLPSASCRAEGNVETSAATRQERADELCWKITAEIEKGLQEKDFHLRTRTAVHALQRHMDLKHIVPLAARTKVAPLLYSAITETEDLDQLLIRNFAKALTRILKPKDGILLDIVLPWRPLYHLINSNYFGKARTPQTPLCHNLGSSLVSLARQARRYFTATANEEIMAELRPLCCPQDMSILKAQGFMSLLLKRSHSDVMQYVEEAMGMWTWVVAYYDWDLMWTTLLSSLARHHYRTHAETWEPLVEQLFQHLLHVLDLPIGTSRTRIYENRDASISYQDGYPFFSLSIFVHKGISSSKASQIVKKAAKLIVYLIRPGGKGSMEVLRRLIKALESFHHPSNHGSWTRRLSQLVASLCEHFRQRVRKERADPDGAPHKLLPSDVTEFSSMVLHGALQGLYSKSGVATLHACSALKQLAFLDPDAVLPKLLDRAYQALTTVLEVHQTTAALEALAAIIYPVLRCENFAVGLNHLPQLMALTLSGVDTNDTRKTWATLRFFTVFLSGVPLIPITEDAPEGEDCERHEVARRVTDFFSDWALRFLDQTMAFISNMGHNPHAEADQKKKGDSDSRTSEYFFECTLEVFFMQLGDDLYGAALDKVANFCFNNLLTQQETNLGVLLTAITDVNPKAAVHKFLPLCLRILLESATPVSTPIMSSRSPGPGLSPGKPERKSDGVDGGAEPSLQREAYKLAVLSDSEFIYYLAIIRFVVQAAGCHVLAFKEQLAAVIDLGLKVEERPGVISRRVFKAANQLTRALIHSLLSYRPQEYRSVPADVWADPQWRKTHYKSWGRVVSLSSVEVEWRKPSKEGLQWASDLAAKYLHSPMRTLRQFMIGLHNNANARVAVVKEEPGPDGAQGEGESKQPNGVQGAGATKAEMPAARKTVNPAPLQIPVMPTRMLSFGVKPGQAVSPYAAGLAVTQARLVLEGMILGMPAWKAGSAADIGADRGAKDHLSFKSAQMHLFENTVASAHELPPPSSAEAITREDVAQLLDELTTVVLQHRPEDIKLLKGIVKCMDVVLNGVDILQKAVKRLSVKYRVLKSQHSEMGDHGKLLPRYAMVARLHHQHLSSLNLLHRKVLPSPTVLALIQHVAQLATYAYKTVRVKGQPALLSACKHYPGATAMVLPALVCLLQDKTETSTAMEQRVIGAANLLQTRFFLGKMLRDWTMIQNFLTALCQSDHHDKLSVHAVIVDLFNSFHTAMYRISLDTPGYCKWVEPAKWDTPWEFAGHSRMQQKLLEILHAKNNLHWRYKLMIVQTVMTNMRDDVAAPLAVWKSVMECAVSDVSHLRRVSMRALGTATEQLQTQQRSKADADGSQRMFPDKNCHRWNGTPPRPAESAYVFASRAAAQRETEGYLKEVETSTMSFLGNEEHVSKLTAVMSVIQSGRSKSFVGGHAQMFKGLFKAFGRRVLESLRGFLNKTVEDLAAPNKENSDVYMGRQCLASEITAGLIRGIKYWSPEDAESAKKLCLEVVAAISSAPEMESVGVWSSALRFAVFDRHPMRVKWLLTFLFDNAAPNTAQEASTSVITCRRLSLLKPILNELSWRGSPLHRQLLHDILPLLGSSYTQTRECAASCLAALSRVSWSPPWPAEDSSATSKPPPAAEGAGGSLEAPQLFGTGVEERPGEAMHSVVVGATRQLLVATRRLEEDEEDAGGAAAGEGEEEGKGSKERDGEAKEEGPDRDASPLGVVAANGKGADGDRRKLKREKEVRVKNLRHSLVCVMTQVCPSFDAMYPCPLAAHLPCLLPSLFHALEDQDQDLTRHAKACAELAANTPMLAWNVLPQVLKAVHQAAKSSSWHVRATVLPFLQILVFRHQFVISASDMEDVQQTMIQLLSDSQVEVREVASDAVAVLVRIGGEALVLGLRSQFSEWAKTPLPPKKPKSSARDKQGDAAAEESQEDAAKRLQGERLRHAGVLGLAALVQANPYEVPAWMPAVLVQLANHVLDPVPIRQTVRKTFGEFWRTHQDAWPMLKSNFTEEQLSTLTNLLVSPTYFS